MRIPKQEKPMKDELRYGHFNELMETGFDYLSGKISIGLFEETVNRILSALRDGEGQFKAVELSSELKAQLGNDLTKIEEGFKLFEDGITKTREFIDNKNKEILWNGLGLIKLGCDFLNQVISHQEKQHNLESEE